MIAGIDEAGRGPVIGPMVMAIVATDDEAELKKMGVADSKDLEPSVRKQLAETLMNKYQYEMISLEPAEIDAAVNGNEDNLNKLEARTTALLIHRLMQRVPLDKVIIDSPAKQTDKYKAVVRAALERLGADDVELVCENKADANYPSAGAASIIAKVTRDAVIKQLTDEHGPLGSGYPSDPMTRAFLVKHWREGHDFFRKSWKSYTRLEESAGQASLADFGQKAEEHADIIKAFDVLKDHGFRFQEPSNQYEVVRMKKDKTSIIRYTTGKIVVQGPEKQQTEKVLAELKLV